MFVILNMKSPLYISFHKYFLIKVFIPQDLGFNFILFYFILCFSHRLDAVWLSSSWCGMWLLSSWCSVCLMSSWCSIFLCEGDLDEQIISDQ